MKPVCVCVCVNNTQRYHISNGASYRSVLTYEELILPLRDSTAINHFTLFLLILSHEKKEKQIPLQVTDCLPKSCETNYQLLNKTFHQLSEWKRTQTISNIVKSLQLKLKSNR